MTNTNSYIRGLIDYDIVEPVDEDYTLTKSKHTLIWADFPSGDYTIKFPDNPDKYDRIVLEDIYRNNRHSILDWNWHNIITSSWSDVATDEISNDAWLYVYVFNGNKWMNLKHKD